jgi:hypothetical protein
MTEVRADLSLGKEKGRWKAIGYIHALKVE